MFRRQVGSGARRRRLGGSPPSSGRSFLMNADSRSRSHSGSAWRCAQSRTHGVVWGSDSTPPTVNSLSGRHCHGKGGAELRGPFLVCAVCVLTRGWATGHGHSRSGNGNPLSSASEPRPHLIHGIALCLTLARAAPVPGQRLRSQPISFERPGSLLHLLQWAFQWRPGDARI